MSDKRCCKCKAKASCCEDLYEYENEIYCDICLGKQLKTDKKIWTRDVTLYFTDDGEELGNDDDWCYVMENICGYFEIERITE